MKEGCLILGLRTCVTVLSECRSSKSGKYGGGVRKNIAQGFFGGLGVGEEWKGTGRRKSERKSKDTVILRQA
jgi:hypothetical protein